MPGDPEDVECTAVVRPGMPRLNPLFTPPCECPQCCWGSSASDEAFDAGVRRDDGWFRIAGQQQRQRVQTVELGHVARTLLG